MDRKKHRSYVAAFENAQKIDGMYVDENDKEMSFCSYKNLLSIGMILTDMVCQQEMQMLENDK